MIGTEEKSFLELRTESEALARGANLSEKIPHAVYRAIRGASSLDQIRTGHVFHVGSPIPELGTLDYRKKELMEVLQQLMKEKLIVQLFRLRFDPTAHQIQLIPCYIASTQDDRANPEQLYMELLMQSVLAVEEYIKTTPAVDREAIQKDIQTDFKSPQAPGLLPATIFDPLKSIEPGSFDFVPAAEMLKHSIGTITEELVRRKLMIQLIEYGWLPIRLEEVIRRFEVAQEFLNTQLIPAHRQNADLMNEVRSIQAQEESYYLEAFVRKSADFAMRKAAALKKHLMSGIDRKNRIPGSLAIELVVKLQPMVEKSYQDSWQKDIDREYREMRESISGKDVPLQDRLKFFEEEDVAEITPEVWRKIISSMDFFHATYEKSDGTCNVLTRNDPQLIPKLVQFLLGVAVEEHWKILAFRALIERYESALQSLFNDIEFVDSYGRLLRKAYWTRMPWYFRILLFLGIQGITDMAFQRAKHKISEEQRGLTDRNQKRRDRMDRQRIIEKKEKIGQAESIELNRRIVELVDRGLYEDKCPPTVPEVSAVIADKSDAELLQFLTSQGFKTLEVEGGRVVLYPVDFHWRTRSARLRRFMENTPAPPDPVAAPRWDAVLRMLRSSGGGPLRSSPGRSSAAPATAAKPVLASEDEPY